MAAAQPGRHFSHARRRSALAAKQQRGVDATYRRRERSSAWNAIAAARLLLTTDAGAGSGRSRAGGRLVLVPGSRLVSGDWDACSAARSGDFAVHAMLSGCRSLRAWPVLASVLAVPASGQGWSVEFGSAAQTVHHRDRLVCQPVSCRPRCSGTCRTSRPEQPPAVGFARRKWSRSKSHESSRPAPDSKDKPDVSVAADAPSGISARSRVPPPGGLSSVSRPSSASTRSASPRRPAPWSVGAADSVIARPRRRAGRASTATRTTTRRAPACLCTLASASATT